MQRCSTCWNQHRRCKDTRRAGRAQLAGGQQAGSVPRAEREELALEPRTPVSSVGALQALGSRLGGLRETHKLGGTAPSVRCSSSPSGALEKSRDHRLSQVGPFHHPTVMPTVPGLSCPPYSGDTSPTPSERTPQQERQNRSQNSTHWPASAFSQEASGCQPNHWTESSRKPLMSGLHPEMLT